MKQSQKSQILSHIKKHGSITTFTAFNKYSICRLSERVRELQSGGHAIQVTYEVRDGKRWARYSLGRKKCQ